LGISFPLILARRSTAPSQMPVAELHRLVVDCGRELNE
jgi:hypothetical protein